MADEKSSRPRVPKGQKSKSNTSIIKLSSAAADEAQKPGDIRFIPLSYVQSDSEASALRLIYTLAPEWEHSGTPVELIKFTDGITNTLLKAVQRRPGLTERQVDEEAILLRAYGEGTDVLIDRARETASHSLLSTYNLAPPLLARFQNGLLYKFLRGAVSTPADLARDPVWRGVAQRLGEWHAVLPLPDTNLAAEKGVSKEIATIRKLLPGKPAHNIWTVTQRWILALPVASRAEKARKAMLQGELERLVKEVAPIPSLGKNGMVFGHCDLLSGNIIIQPRSRSKPPLDGVESVSFIDYEYASPTPAAFELANHFSEWGGLSLDPSALPTRTQRLAFITEYLHSYHLHSGLPAPTKDDAARLAAEVDLFRGVPGFYWGVWALIQKGISQIEFDYAGYAEARLGEFAAWRAEAEGREVREGSARERERRWALE
ncbi:MAG: hypothetical protein M1829_000124 [Trizodia sp. TS-e1964]|nr:MAG: hypothetical protein M1829_000124 [Trizodia sp. TS-e1964]